MGTLKAIPHGLPMNSLLLTLIIFVVGLLVVSAVVWFINLFEV